MSYAAKESFSCKNQFVLGQPEENGGDIDLAGIWKNCSETGQKQSRFFFHKFVFSLGRDNSNDTHLILLGSFYLLIIRNHLQIW